MSRIPTKLFLRIITLVMALSFVLNPRVFPTAALDAQSIEKPSVVIYDEANFRGRWRPFSVGRYRLFNDADFNDVASSIKVPVGLAVIVYEHADTGGGYGESVDFLEDQADLSKYSFDNKISYLEVFSIKRGSEAYERNKIENGRFVQGRWIPASDVHVNPNPVVAPFKPENVPEITSFEAEPDLIHHGQSTTLRWQTKNAERVVIGERYPGTPQHPGTQSITWQGAVEPSAISRKNPAQPTVYVLRAEKGDQSTTKTVFVNVRPAPPTFCSVSGQVIGNLASYWTSVELRRTDTNEVVMRQRVSGVSFQFENVPVGSYKIVPKAARFPAENGDPSNLGFLPKEDRITCRQNMPRPFSLQFRIHRYTDG